MSNDDLPIIYAHRGASASHPENSVAAFRAASEQRSDWVELDVRLTVDGALVVHHDAHYGDGRPIWHTPSGERPRGVPLLVEALDACVGMGVNVEIKNTPGDLGGDDVPHDVVVAEAVLEALSARRGTGEDQEVLVSSFDEVTLTRVRGEDPDVPTGLLVFDLATDAAAPERAAAAGDAAIHPWDPFVDAALVGRCTELGLAVNVWTVDDPERIRQLADLGVAGIITNRPAEARAVLEGR